MRTLIISLSFCTFLFGSLVLADSSVPPEHQNHCRKWQNGRCVEGKLTDLAKGLLDKTQAPTNDERGRSEVCDRVCKEGCSNCKNCRYCNLCNWYNSDSCRNVPYYKDRETCEVGYTNSCCDLCERQCKAPGGVCTQGGQCRGGDADTNLLKYCIERTTNDICMPCDEIN